MTPKNKAPKSHAKSKKYPSSMLFTSGLFVHVLRAVVHAVVIGIFGCW